MWSLISLKSATKGAGIIHTVVNYLGENNLGLEILSGISTDSASAIISKKKKKKWSYRIIDK